jgi:hypothetical protein
MRSGIRDPAFDAMVIYAGNLDQRNEAVVIRLDEPRAINRHSPWQGVTALPESKPPAAPAPLEPRDALMTEWYLVWIEGPRGPEPQKWSSEGLWGQLGRQDVIVRFALTDQEAKLSLDQLARLHPVPIK